MNATTPPCAVSRSRRGGRPPLQALLAIPAAVAIFVVDTYTPLGSAVAVLYGIVLMLAASVLRGGRLILAAVGCAALTVVSYVVEHGFAVHESSGLRCLVSLSAITVTTFLLLRNQTSNRRLEGQAALLDQTHDAIFARRLDGALVYWNRAAEDLYGWSAQEVLGVNAHELLGSRFERDPAVIEQELLRNDRWEGEVIHHGRDGAEYIMDSRWALRRDEHGRPVAIMETNTDITKRRQADAQLLQAQADLAQASRLTTLGQFTATIAHEVNQPLGAIATNGEAALRFLGRPQPDLEEVRGALERIIQGSKRASEVVARVRATLKKGAPEKVRVDLGEVIEEAGQLVQREFQSRSVTLLLHVDPGLPGVLGDRVQLQQVLINLMINGAQAMTEVDGQRRLAVSAGLAEDRCIRVQVRDTGPGIAEADMQSLFGAFFTTKPNGMGLGLAICRSTIESHGGEIRALQPDGPGALIEFTLPAAEEDPA